MVGKHGLSGFSRYENFGILTSNHESNFENFFGILGKNGQNFGIFGGKIVNFHVFGPPEGVQTAICK